MDTIKNAVIGLVIIGFAYTLTSSFLSLWTSSPIPAAPTATRTPGEEVTTAEAEKNQQTLESQAAAAADQQATQTGKKVISVGSCGAETEVPSDWADDVYKNFKCITLTQGQAADCLTLYPNPCGTGKECCQ